MSNNINKKNEKENNINSVYNYNNEDYYGKNNKKKKIKNNDTKNNFSFDKIKNKNSNVDTIDDENKENFNYYSEKVDKKIKSENKKNLILSETTIEISKKIISIVIGLIALITAFFIFKNLPNIFDLDTFLFSNQTENKEDKKTEIDTNKKENNIVTEKMNIVQNPENNKWIKIKYDNDTKNTKIAFYVKDENDNIQEKETVYDKINDKNFMENLYIYYELEENETSYLIYAYNKTEYAKGFSIYLPKSERNKDYYILEKTKIVTDKDLNNNQINNFYFHYGY